MVHNLMDHIPSLKLYGNYGIKFELGDEILKYSYFEFCKLICDALPGAHFKMETPTLGRTRKKRTRELELISKQGETFKYRGSFHD